MLQKSYFLNFLTASLMALCLLGCTSSPTLESTGQYLDNSLITTKVKAKLFAEMKFDSVEVKVKSYKDEVQLSGFVDEKWIKVQAEKIAWSVPGVKKVRNDLIVKSEAG